MGDPFDVTSAPTDVRIDLTEPSPPAGAEERLARVERLLEADLSSLGPSVVTASIGEVLARLDELGARVGAIEVIAPLSSDAPSLLHVEDRLDRLDRRLDRLTRLVEAATAPLEDGEPSDPALARIEEAIAGLTAVVRQLAEAVDAASSRFERVTSGGPLAGRSSRPFG